MSNQPLYTNVPDIPSGYPINGEWFVVVPIARTNEVLNPSLETNLTGYTAGAGVLQRLATKQYHGVYSAAYTPSAALTDGFYYTFTLNWTAGQFRAVSCKFLGVANVSYALTVATTGGVDLVTYSFKGTGRWQWIWLYWLEVSTTTRRIYFRKNGSASIATFYVDGVQSEVINTGESVSTYIDGDQQGFVVNQLPLAYGWNGTPHASSSYRSARTRAGGYMIPFKRYGFLLMAVVGLGLATPQNVKTEYAQLDGGYPSYTRKPTDQFSIVGNISAGTYRALRAGRSALSQFMDRDAVALDQPQLLMYRHTDNCGDIQSDLVTIPCKYVSGWEGQTNNHAAQIVNLTFETYLPSLSADGGAGAALSAQATVTNTDYIVKRSPSGVWSAPGGGTGSVFAIARGLDGKIYLAGNFANWGGDANADNIVAYDPVTGTYSALSTGTNGGVESLAVLPDGRLVLGGSFTLAGGVANTVRIAVYNPITNLFSALGTGASSNSVSALTIDSTGNIYAGGSFGAMGGVANTLRLAKWNGSVWSALSTGADGTVNALLAAKDGKLYITGQFINLGAVASLQIGYWDGTAFHAMGTGLNSTGGRALAQGPSGRIYVGGIFTSAGGVTGTSHVASWNGVAFTGMGGGLGSDVLSLSVDPVGNVYATGSFAGVSGGIAFPDGVARFNGSAWTTIGIDTPAISGLINAAYAGLDGSLYLVYAGTGNSIVEGVTSVTVLGTAHTYPTVTIKGPSSGSARIYSLVNYTTNMSIFFNLTINAGETCTLDFRPDRLSFTSDFQGNITSTILQGSDSTDFFLQQGQANNLAFFAASSTVTPTLLYTVQYASLDDLQ